MKARAAGAAEELGAAAAPPARVARPGLRIRLDPLQLLGIVLLILVWSALTAVVPASSLPPPQNVARRLAADFFAAPELSYYGLGDASLLGSMLYTAANVVAAVALGGFLGSLAGLVTARFDLTRAVLDPVVLTAGTVPILVAAPFFLIWFGTGRASSVVLVTVYVAVILYVFAQRAADNLDPVYEDSARTLGAKPRDIVRDILLPGAVPAILGGVRIALAGAWGLEAIAELLGAQEGIGKIVEVLAGATDVEGIFAALLLLGLVAVVCDALAALAFARLAGWSLPARAGGGMRMGQEGAAGPMIALERVSRTFRRADGQEVRAVDEVTLAVPEGQFVCMVGPSGCGKSTILQMVAGLLLPSSGTIRAAGAPVTGPSPQRGVVFQRDSVFPWMRVIDNVEYGLRCRGIARAERQPVARRYLEAVGLGHVARAWPRELSGGMLKRVAVATVFANDAAVLLLDEPFGALDYVTRHQLHDVLLDLWADSTGGRGRRTVIFVTHDVDEALTLADRIVVMRGGRLIDDLAVTAAAAARPRTADSLVTPEMVRLKHVLLAHLGIERAARPNAAA